jgi:hypothetical protein
MRRPARWRRQRDRAEDAERGAAHNLECGHRNLRMRA